MKQKHYETITRILKRIQIFNKLCCYLRLITTN